MGVPILLRLVGDVLSFVLVNMSDEGKRREDPLLAQMSNIMDLFEAVGVDTIATALYSEQIINKDTYQFMDLDKTDRKKCKKLVMGVITTVKISSEKYDKFVKVLDDNSEEKDTITILKKECKLAT